MSGNISTPETLSGFNYLESVFAEDLDVLALNGLYAIYRGTTETAIPLLTRRDKTLLNQPAYQVVSDGLAKIANPESSQLPEFYEQLAVDLKPKLETVTQFQKKLGDYASRRLVYFEVGRSHTDYAVAPRALLAEDRVHNRLLVPVIHKFEQKVAKQHGKAKLLLPELRKKI